MITAAIALLLAGSSAASNIGPQPALEEFSALADPALANQMKPTRAVTFKWPYQLLAGPGGYHTCGLVHTLNNKTERQKVWVSAVVANGKVVDSQWSTLNGMLAWQCENLVRKGALLKR